jgi:hypothetical protein
VASKLNHNGSDATLWGWLPVTGAVLCTSPNPLATHTHRRTGGGYVRGCAVAQFHFKRQKSKDEDDDDDAA